MAYYILCLSVLLYLAEVTAGYLNCTYEPKCDCVPLPSFSQLYIVNCSDRGVTNITEIPKEYKEKIYSIDMSQNSLQFLSDEQGHYPTTLKQLNLSFNDLSDLSSYSFRGIPYLELLDLSHNALNRSLPKHVFQYLSNLKVLNVSFNSFSDLEEYNVDWFTPLQSLQTLVIDGLKEGKFKFVSEEKPRVSASSEHGFDLQSKTKLVKLEHLQTLIVSGRTNNTKCLVQNLTADFFESVPNLQYLDMSGCNIQSVDPHLNFENLTYLDLSYNEKLTFSFFSSFRVPKLLKTLKLDKIHCTYGIGTYLTVELVKNFQNSSIETLSIASNRLEILELKSILFFPPNLTNLDVSDNRLTFGRYLLYMPNMKNLKYLNISNQHTTHFTGKAKDFVECKNAPLCVSSSPMKNISELTHLQPSVLFEIHVPPRLELIDYTKSSLNSEIKRAVFNVNNSMKYINLSQNYFEALHGPIYGLNKVEFIDFSHNVISILSPNFFENFTSIKVLNMGGNLLGKNVSTEAQPYFKTLRNLTILDLSQNGIHFIEMEIFEGLVSLTTLNLSHNSLRNFSLREGQLESLTMLDLSNNELASFSDEMMAVLKSIQQHHPLEINMTENEIRCTCDSLDFLKWISNSAIAFHIGKLLSSQNVPIPISNSLELDMQVKLLVKKCGDYEEIIGVVSALYVVFLAGVIGGILYRYRWKLRYIYYMSKWSSTSSRKSYSKIYGYDAFVSYADEEKDFVTGEMTSELEDTSGMVLCLHERDFTPGKSIGENITKSICESRKILCVVTENFLSSQWCMYELEMALTDYKYSRDEQSVFLIMYGGLPTDSSKIQSSIRLMSLVEKNAYLEYPQDESNKTEFWNSIRAILKTETGS